MFVDSMFQTLLVCVLAIVVVVVSAVDGEILQPINTVRNLQARTAQEDLDQAKLLWETVTRRGLPTLDYSYGWRETVSSSSSIGDGDGGNSEQTFAGPLAVDVRNDSVTNVAPPFGADDGEEYDPANFLTVEGYFDLIQESINEMAGGVEVSAVSYNQQYGYPLRIEIATSTSDGDAQTTSRRTYHFH
jgi:hypothetical protein